MFEEEEGLDQRKVSFLKRVDILAALGLCCCMRDFSFFLFLWDFSSCGQGPLSCGRTWSVGQLTQ